ncbi:MAG: gliding motility-associated C-terminal domain-containing protein [Pedobacter sp.]|uniref:DUF7507 domain-containing protein n=1 Tax=Pedobacter sp. TaxID=1411316 RepID=UPI00339B9909
MSGTFPYTVTANGGCTSPQLTGTITVTPNATLVLTSGDVAQTKCINTAISDIVYTFANATDATVTALPSGLRADISAGGVFTISGTPTVSGTFPYTVTANGGCTSPQLTGTITVTPNATLVLTSGPASQTKCINTAIENIVYTFANAIDATVTALPSGLRAVISAGGVFTISGTPTVSGTFPYTVTANGGCTSPQLTGTITVTSNATLVLTSGNVAQTKCINTAIENIVYTFANATDATVTALPAGLRGNISAGGVFTISGTPTVSGTFPYTVTANGGCTSPQLSGTITVTPNATLVLTSGGSAQTPCINTAIENIVYTFTNATTATVTGLPAGVTGRVTAAGVITISGTPTVSGPFSYTVTATGECVSASLAGTITVKPDATIVLTSGGTAQNPCINTAIENIVYTFSNATTATVTGLPAGVAGGVTSAGVFTISGTPTVPGPFSYTVTATGECASAGLSGTITVTPDATIVLTSGGTAQTPCINTAIENIVYTFTNATTATVTGLPAGVSGRVTAAGVFTISGTPTVSGPFSYTVTATGECASASLSGTITVKPIAGIVLTSGGTAQTPCINTAIDNIVYTFTNANSASVNGLPSGISGTISSSGVFTISGTPTVSGSFTYTVTANGDCTSPQLSGTITVKPNTTLVLSSGNINQTPCINTEIIDIVYNYANANTVTVTGLPAGVIGSIGANGIFRISGTPTVIGSFAYTVTANGDCSSPILTGTINVNPNTTLQLTSAAATKAQTVCLNCEISTITYKATNATTVTASGLPTGVTSTYANGTLTISGSPSVLGTFNYIVTAAGTCSTEQLTGVITVTESPAIKLVKTGALSADKNTINYTFTVTNTGNVTLKNLTLTDAKIPGLTIATALTLAPNASTTINAGYTIIQAEKDARTVSNTAKATGLSPGNATVTDISGTSQTSDAPTVIAVPETPAIRLVKTGTLSADKNTINYTFTVTNTGNVTLKNLTLTDAKIPGLTIATALTLAPNASTTVNAVYTITQAEKDARTVSNTAKATGVSPGNATVTDVSGTSQISDAPTVIAVPETPAIRLVKTGVLSADKNTINYSFTITNTGNVTLKNLTLRDIKIPGLTVAANLTLAPNASTTVTATYPITQAEKDARRVSNTATVTGVSPANTTVTDISGTDQNSDAPTVISVPQTPSIILTKIASGTIPSAINGVITYSLKVTNTGTVTLYNLIVTDPNAMITSGSPIASLAPDASAIVTATHKLTQADIDAGKVINQATVKGTDPNNGEVTKVSDDPSTTTPDDPTVTPLNQSGAIGLVKTGVLNSSSTGVTFTFTITNTGNVTLKNIVLTDPMLGGEIALSNTILVPGQTISVNKTYTLTQQDKNAGKITNTATVKGITPGNTTVTDVSGTDLQNNSPTVVVVELQPRVALVKTGVLRSDFATITYTFLITNTGNVTLTELNLVDTKFSGSISLSKTVLEPGESTTTTAVYTITDAEKRDGKVLNTATVTATSPSGSPVRDISGTQSTNDDPTLHIIDDAPQAINDNGETKINQPVTVNLAGNDLPSFNGIDKGSIIITKFPTNGQVQINGDGTIVYTPNRGYSGPDDFRYTINDLKGKVSNVALVNITVTPIDLFIPNTFTPNGDGKNDTFKIMGRESFDSINLLIFNRWGNEVYRNTNYLDEWDGSGLSEGTYYYIIVLKKGANEATRKGWILLKR